MLLRRFLRFRYTLRALFVFITLFALWGGYHANLASRERAAEQLLVRAGAELTSYSPGFSLWRYRFIGDVQHLPVLDEPSSRALADLPYLRVLNIQSPRRKDTNDIGGPVLNGAVLARALAGLKLSQLTLGGFTLDDEACAAIGKNRGLQKLTLEECDLSEMGFARILKAPNLERLRMWWCTPTGVRLGDAPGSAKLEDLDLVEVPVCDDFGAFLSRCARLKAISVGDAHVGRRVNRITDEFVERLGSHPSLESLHISGSSVNGTCADVIARMRSLRDGSVPGTFSREARERLKTARPDLGFAQ